MNEPNPAQTRHEGLDHMEELEAVYFHYDFVKKINEIIKKMNRIMDILNERLSHE